MKIKNDFISKIKCLFRRVKKLELSQEAGTTVSWSEVTDKPTTFAPAAHTHTIAQVTGLQGELDSKANSTDIPDVSGFATINELTTGLADKANTSHTHTIAQVTNLQTELNNKLTASQGAAVADAVDETDVVAQFNSLLASLRAAGIIST